MRTKASPPVRAWSIHDLETPPHRHDLTTHDATTGLAPVLDLPTFLAKADPSSFGAGRRNRAREAERRATAAKDRRAKRGYEWRALRNWIAAAQREPPGQNRLSASSHASARLAAARLEAFGRSDKERATFAAVQSLLDGDFDAARATLETGGSKVLARGLERAQRSVDTARLIDTVARGASDLSSELDAFEAIHPGAALDVASLRLSVGVEDPTAVIEAAWSTLPAPTLADLGHYELLRVRWAPDSETGAAIAADVASNPALPEAHRELARLAQFEHAANGGNLRTALAAAHDLRCRAQGPERRALAGLLEVAVLVETNEPAALDRADHILRNTLEELGHRRSGDAKASGQLGVRLAPDVDKAEDQPRGPTADMKVMIEEALITRSQVAMLRNKPNRAHRYLNAVRSTTFRSEGRVERLHGQLHRNDVAAVRDDLVGERRRFARTFSLASLAKHTRTPLRRTLDEPRADDGHTLGMLDPTSMRLTLERMGLISKMAEPEHPIASMFRSSDGDFGGAIGALLSAGSSVGAVDRPSSVRRWDGLKRAIGRDLVAHFVQTDPIPCATRLAGLIGYDHDDRKLDDAERTMAHGLSRPGEADELARLASLFGTSNHFDGKTTRPTNEAVLAAGKQIAVAAGHIQPGKVPTYERDATFREIESVLMSGPSFRSRADAQRRLAGIGFEQKSEELMARNGQQVRVRSFAVGPSLGISAELLRKNGEQGQRIVRVGKRTFDGATWQLFEHGYQRELTRYRRARRRTRDFARLEKVTDMTSLRSFISARGRTAEGSRRKRDKLEVLRKLESRAATLLQQLKADGNLPSGFYVMVDGIDAASKTSNGRAIVNLLEGVGFESDWLSFRAPTEEERTHHFLDRFDEHRPTAGRVFFADRSPLGDFAYDPNLDPKDAEKMGHDFAAWERSMRDDGIEVIKLLFYPGEAPEEEEAIEGELPELWRPMFTFGKRQARAEAARDVATELESRGRDVPDGLVEAAELGPGANDLASFMNGVDVHERFAGAAHLTAGDTDHPWTEISTSRRQAGRVAVMQAFVARLEQLVANS